MAGRSRILCILLALGAAAAALDLTTFRTSYAHYSRFSCATDLSASGEWASDSLQSGSGQLTFDGIGSWRSETRADDYELSVLVPMSASVQSGRMMRELADTTIEASSRHDLLYFWPKLTARAYARGTDFSIEAALSSSLMSWGDYSATAGRLGQRGSVDVLPRLGWGRIRDAWPLLKASRIATLLEREGVLVRNPTDDELRSVAEFLSRSWKLSLAHQRSDRYYYDSLSVLLEGMGVTQGSLPARAVMRLDEALYVGSYERRFGWQVWAGARAGYGLWRRQDSHADSAVTEVGHGVSLVPTACVEFARLFGLSWGLDARFDYQLDANWDSLVMVEHGFTLDVAASWQVLDRLEIGLSPGCRVRLTEQMAEFEPSRLQWNAAVDLSGSYYLVDQLRASVGVRWVAYQNRLLEPAPVELNRGSNLSLSFKLHWGPLPRGWGVRYYL